MGSRGRSPRAVGSGSSDIEFDPNGGLEVLVLDGASAKQGRLTGRSHGCGCPGARTSARARPPMAAACGSKRATSVTSRACNPRPRWSGGSRITGCCRPDNLSGVEFMDYVRAGQVIRLGPHQTIVLLRGIGGAPQRPSILEGRQSAEITLAVLMRPFAVTWTEQRKTLIGCLPRSPACLDAMP
jgi:hypothetical protein